MSYLCQKGKKNIVDNLLYLNQFISGTRGKRLRSVSKVI